MEELGNFIEYLANVMLIYIVILCFFHAKKAFENNKNDMFFIFSFALACSLDILSVIF